MLEFFQIVYNGIFTEPSTSVVALLIAVCIGLSWLLLKFIREQHVVMEKFIKAMKESSLERSKLHAEIIEAKQETINNRIVLASMNSKFEQYERKLEVALKNIPKRSEDKTD